MRLLLLSFLAVGSLLSGGCALHEIEGEVGGVEVEARTGEGRGENGDFCPPGQAKKGNC